jgi:hypothetical protein
MTETKSSGVFRKILTRVMAAGALLVVYCMTTIGVTSVVMTTGVTTAEGGRRGRRGRRGRGRRGRGRRGRGRRGRGFGGIFLDVDPEPDTCHTRRSRLFVC